MSPVGLHFVHHLRDASPAKRRIVMMVTINLLIVMVALGVWMTLFQGHRKPPNIFDTPVDDVSEYLASKDFNALSTKERLAYIEGLLKRFNSMSQTDSAVAAAFFAGLSGKAGEQLMNNARNLGKDILLEGAQEFLALKTDEEKSKFLDQWLVTWVRFAEGMDPDGRPRRNGGGTNEDILNGLSKQANRDAQRSGDMNAIMAQQLVDFWQRDIASVASPKEQGQLFAFLPAVRDHLVHRGK